MMYHNYIYIPLVLCLVYVVFYLNSNFLFNGFPYKRLTRLDILFNRFLFIRRLRVYIANKLLLINLDMNKTNFLPSMLLLLYFMLIAAGIGAAFFYGATWYVSILIICCFCTVPVLTFNLFVDYFLKKITNELPLAVEEISEGFKVTDTLNGAIRYALPTMDKHSFALFKKLSYYMEHEDPERCINKFLIKTNNRWLNMLGVIFLTYSQKGGDLSRHLDYFVDVISCFFINREKNKYALFMAKALLVVFILNIPVAMSMMSSLFPAASIIYTTDTRAINLIALCIVLSFVSFIALLFIERR